MKQHHVHGRRYGRPGGWQQAHQPDAGDAAEWFAGRLPDDWFDGDPTVVVDREEITVIGKLSAPADSAEESAARASGRVMVEDLARRFEVSAQTIRKDLNDLCEQRALTRIHGGAIIASGVENLAYEARRFVAADEKAFGSPTGAAA